MGLSSDEGEEVEGVRVEEEWCRGGKDENQGGGEGGVFVVLR